jgi:hypothetical protein
MAITPSGQVKFSDLRTEFIGGSGSVPIGSLYRGGSNIRSKAPNNTGVNLAADVPTSGELQLSDYYGTAKGFKFTYSSSGTDQNASSLFGNDYAVDYPKEIVIPSSVTLGTNNTSEYALEIDSGASGTITVTNNGTIIGAGGSGGGGGGANSGTGSSGSAGGDAIKIASATTFVNNGSILAGGGGAGGGGGGGVGGNLSQQQQTTGQQGPHLYYSTVQGIGVSYWRVTTRPSNTNPMQARVWYGRTSPTAPRVSENSTPNFYTVTSITQGQYTYGRGPFVSQQAYYDDNNPNTIGHTWRIYRTFPQQQQTTATGGNGGAGGAGGLGRGYNNQPGGDPGNSGGGGSPSTAGNGGNGGTGGTGGGYGQSGATGSTGSTGTPSTTSGSSGGGGGSGGAAGLAVERASPISFTFTNNGTVAGTVQS